MLRRTEQKSAFSYILPFLILIALVGGGFFGIRYYLESGSSKEAEQIRPVATLTIESGRVEVKLVDVSTWGVATSGMILYTGDSVRTLADSVAVITYFDNSVTRLAADSELLLKNLQNDDTQDVVSLELKEGKMWSRVMKVVDENSRFEVETPTAVATVRGTAFEIVVERQLRTNANTGEQEEFYKTELRVVENEVGLRVVEKIVTKDTDGNIRTENRVLASVILPEGSESAVGTDDVDAFNQRPGSKPIIRTIDQDTRESEWYLWNLGEDEDHLNEVRESLQRMIDDMSDQSFIDRFMRSQRESDREDILKEVFYSVESQLKKLRGDGSARRGGSSTGTGEDVDDGDIGDDTGEGTWPNGTSGTNDKPQDRQHIVQPGDTLSSISQRYGVSITDLMRANGITDPDFLQVGDELIIPGDLSDLPELVVKPAIRPFFNNTDDTTDDTNVADSEAFESVESVEK